jgi:hypothetical protein
MTYRAKSFLFLCLGFLIVGGFFFVGGDVLAQSSAVDRLRNGAKGLAVGANLGINGSTPGTTVPLPTLVGRIIGNILSLLGIIFLILTIYAGLLWMFSRGDESKAAKAADIIKGAIIGLIVVLGSYAITNLVFDAVGVPGGDSLPAASTPTDSLQAPPPGFYQSCTTGADCPTGLVCYMGNCT